MSVITLDWYTTKLHLQWTRQYPKREPAWIDPVNRDRMPYDKVVGIVDCTSALVSKLAKS